MLAGTLHASNITGVVIHNDLDTAEDDGGNGSSSESDDGKYFVLMGPESAENRNAILGVITIVGERSWFIKLTGPADLAEREKDNFETFARSVRF